MLDLTLPLAITLGWVLLGLATLPRGSGWPLWLIAGAQFVLTLFATALVHGYARPAAFAPGLANLWFLTTVLAAATSRSSAALVTQQLTIAAAMVPLVVYGFQAQAPSRSRPILSGATSSSCSVSGSSPTASSARLSACTPPQYGWSRSAACVSKLS